MTHARVRTGGCERDHRPAVRVTAQHDRPVDTVEHRAHVRRRLVQVRGGTGAVAVTGEVDGDGLDPRRVEERDDLLPAPRPVPRPVHEDDGGRHGAGAYAPAPGGWSASRAASRAARPRASARRVVGATSTPITTEIATTIQIDTPTNSATSTRTRNVTAVVDRPVHEQRAGRPRRERHALAGRRAHAVAFTSVILMFSRFANRRPFATGLVSTPIAAGAQRADRAPVAGDVRERVVAEEPHRVLVRHRVDLGVGRARTGELAVQLLGGAGPARVGVRVVDLDGDAVDADVAASFTPTGSEMKHSTTCSRKTSLGIFEPKSAPVHALCTR